MKKYLGNKLAIGLFIFPALAIFTIFIFFPIVQSFVYSFFDWNGIGKATFTGLENYGRLFTDKTFFTANRNQLIFAIFITLYQMIFATVFAITISNPKVKGRKFFRVAYFIPVVLSVTVVCQLWLSVFNASWQNISLHIIPSFSYFLQISQTLCKCSFIMSNLSRIPCSS